MSNQIAIRPILLALGIGACWLSGARAALEPDQVEPLAVEIAYRLDRELGEVDGAQRHLLIWRLSSALRGGEFAPGAALSRQILEWQHQLEAVEPPPGQALPAWFAPQVPDTLSALLLAGAPNLEYASWHWPVRMRLAATAARLATGPEPRPWVRAQQLHHLAWARDHGAVIWADFLALLAANPDWQPLIAPALAGWTALPLDAPLSQWRALNDRAAAELAELKRDGDDPLLALITAEAATLKSEDLLIEHRDPLRLRLAPYRAFRHAQPDAFDRALVALARAIRGVAGGGYGELTQVLLGMAEIALLDPTAVDATRLRAVLDALAAIDPVVLEMVEAVDLRLLAVYQQVRKLLRDLAAGSGPPVEDGLRWLASLHAAHGADAADLDGYVSQPVRARVETDVLVCFDASRDRPPYPQEPITPSQFERCLGDFLDWAVVQAASPELAGRAGGPFEPDQLARELSLSPWQRINYWFGWLRTRLGSACAAGEDAVVNPLEWALAARAYVRFAHRWPAYYASADRAEQLAQLTSAGSAAIERIGRLRLCAAADRGPPLEYLIDEYGNALAAAVAAIEQESARYRTIHLKADADVELSGGARQPTNYRPTDLTVTPCDSRPSCDMGDALPPSRALLGLFPQPYLVADQIRLGSLRLCYTNVMWVDRRAEAPPVRNPAMARYFGRLSFELQGRFGGAAEPVFSMRLTSRDEYEYLFAENSSSVLDDPCPRHLIGTQVRSELPPRTLQLVPRRLTFMTADRMHPAKVFQAHWATGNEWRDRFVTGQGVEVLIQNGPEPILDAVESRLSDLYRGWNRSVYEAMLDERADERNATRRAMREVDRIRRMVAAFAKLLEPHARTFDPAIRAGVAGGGGLFGRDQVLKMRQQGVPVDQVAPIAMSRFEDTRYLFSQNQGGSDRRAAADRIILGTLLQLAELEQHP